MAHLETQGVFVTPAKPTCMDLGITHAWKFVVRSSVNLILTWQTCGQGSSMSAGSKHQALAFYFPARIWNMFLVSRCTGEWDQGLCTFPVLAKKMRLCSADFRRILRPNTGFDRKSALCSRILFASTGKVHRPWSRSPLPFDIRNMYQICMEKWVADCWRLLPAAMLVRWPQVFHVKMTFGLLLTNWFVSTKTDSMTPLKVDSTWESAFVREIPNPTLKTHGFLIFPICAGPKKEL